MNNIGIIIILSGICGAFFGYVAGFWAGVKSVEVTSWEEFAKGDKGD